MVDPPATLTASTATMTLPALAVPAPPITAVLVTRGVTPYLADTLAALAAQTRPPTRVVVVDAAARPTPGDDVAQLATGSLPALGADLHVIPVPAARTFGYAVRGALSALSALSARPARAAGSAPAGGGDSTGWLWLLHDDSAPTPTALAELVRSVEHSPSVAIAGAKQRSWTDPGRLLEVGVTTSRFGRRMTGVDEDEVDQGQHDGREDVLGVGTAGALVRRDVWDALGGTDPLLGPFGDGLDLCRRARLAGHRVVVVPDAVVLHAQASYRGLRRAAAAPDERPVTDAPASTTARSGGVDGHRSGGDPRRSFGARRRAHVHARLAAAPAVLLPLLGIGFLIAGLLRSLIRVASKDPALAVAELAAPVAALLHPGRMARVRRAARRGAVLSRRSLRPLQGSWRDVVREQQEAHFVRAEQRRLGGAPSELELSELAALSHRRRLGLGVLVVALVALTALVLGDLIAAVLGGGSLVGGGLLPAQAGLGELWRAATSGWVAGDLGSPGPADTLLAVLAPVAAITGAGTAGAVNLLFLGALLLAGLGAWFAAGAATRSVGTRLWAALVWVAAPGLALAVDGGRLGAILAHLALPWAALGVARAIGVQRHDVVLSGLVGARRGRDDVPDADAALPADASAELPAAATAVLPAAATAVLPAATTAVLPAATTTTDLAATAAEPPAAIADPDPATPAAIPAEQPGQPEHPSLIPAPTGSIGAAAAAGLAFAVVVAGAPVLLPFGLLALLGVGAIAPRRRLRLVLVALPALALAGPAIAQALGTAGRGGWRLLLADAGLPLPSRGAPSWQQLLGWPVRPTGAVFGWLPEPVARVLPFVLVGVVILLALLALLRGAAVARGVRAGWLVGAFGLAAALTSARIETAAGTSAVVRGWPGPGVSLLLLGLLTAAVLGTDGLRARMARHTFGWRQLGVVAVTALAVLALLVPLTEWAVRARTTSVADPGGLQVIASSRTVVPAVGQQAQTSSGQSRVLALAVGAGGAVDYQLLRADGPQLTDVAAAVDARTVRGAPGAPTVAPADAAATTVARVVARLSAAAAGNVSGALSDLAVANVLVPPTPTADPARKAARALLVGRLDATAGLERITENSSGVIWRVAGAAGAVRTADRSAWARVSTAGATGQPATTVPLAAQRLAVNTHVPAGGPTRQVLLAERADPGWRAWLNDRPLRVVAGDWRQTFDLGAAAGHLSVSYDPAARTPWLALQAVVLLLTGLFALPVHRRRGGTR
jgi:GT2 family glycosyltransferase